MCLSFPSETGILLVLLSLPPRLTSTITMAITKRGCQRRWSSRSRPGQSQIHVRSALRCNPLWRGAGQQSTIGSTHASPFFLDGMFLWGRSAKHTAAKTMADQAKQAKRGAVSAERKSAIEPSRAKPGPKRPAVGSTEAGAASRSGTRWVIITRGYRYLSFTPCAYMCSSHLYSG